MSILITGGTGSLGAFLAKRMLDSEENIILFDAKPNYKIISDILPRVKVFS
jgi:nucleoside-diphosphate-sugar epimerase